MNHCRKDLEPGNIIGRGTAELSNRVG